ncbi:hypothetical protein I317_05546 [Kwoniella heveanensis CBS 569]|nr:hypothetical protein I317_05546 [Kwoniella heveanensis CBS 569]
MFTLKSLSISPSRTSLSIPTSSSLGLSPGAGTGPPSPSHSNTSATATSGAGRSPSSDRTSYFPGPISAPTTPTSTIPSGPKSRHRYVSREEALKTVKALEDVLVAWNEYRIAIASVGKSGRKLSNAMKGLAGCIDKTEVAAQTIRPTASLLENLSDLTLKLSKKVDKEYDDANSDASKYFNLLAKESRTHDAYMNAISKKHDKAEKAYRKASKSLSDTAGAHSGLLALKDTLSADISRAQDDHYSLIGAKQASILLRLASSSGVLSSHLLSFYSDGLRKSSSSYPDIEYFRCLADAKWTSSLPLSLEDELEEDRRRDDIRLIKARVALGESDIVGQSAWATIKGTPGAAVIGADDVSAASATATAAGIGSAGDTTLPVAGGGADVAASKDLSTINKQSPIAAAQHAVPLAKLSSVTASDKTSAFDQSDPRAGDDIATGAGRQTVSPPIPHHSRPSLSTQSSSAASINTTTSASLPSDAHLPRSSVSSSSTGLGSKPRQGTGPHEGSPPYDDPAPPRIHRYVSSGLPGQSKPSAQDEKRPSATTEYRARVRASTMMDGAEVRMKLQGSMGMVQPRSVEPS